MYKQNRTLKKLAIIALILTLSAIFAAHAAAETTVYADAPEYVLSDTFDVEIMIEDVYELDSGEFHLLFDPNVVDVTDVTAGDIGNMNVGFTNKRSDKIQGIGIIKATFYISGTDGVSGSGSLVTVGFNVTGSDGNCSILNISNTEYVYLFDEGQLWDWSAEEITAKWENDIVCIGDSSLPEAKVTIFVENHDDDDLFVKLFIDGDFKKQDEIKKNNNETYYEGLILPEGVHTFEIRWHDHDTNKDYVKTEEHNVSGTTAVTLMTDKHTEDDDKLSAIVGDVNNDNRITAADSVLALQMSVGSIVPDPESADVSGDGMISSLDALMILMIVPKTQVCVNAPETVSDAFNVTIDIRNVADLCSGQFDLSFNSSVVNVANVDSGSIGGTEVHVDMWRLMDDGRVRVLFRCPGATVVSGSGSLATIHFEVTGAAGDRNVLDVSGGSLFGYRSLFIDNFTLVEVYEIPAIWNDCEVTIGVPVTVNASEIVSGTFNATIDIRNVTDLDSGQFDLSFDSSVVNVTAVCDGNIGGTTMPISDWRFMDVDTIRVLFDLSGVDTVSGSGSLATIHFEVTGAAGDRSALDISNGGLFDLDTYSAGIPATWTDCEVTV